MTTTTPHAQTAQPAVSARNLSKTYGMGEATVHALNNVSVDFEQGKFTAIMGPSGSGKSTLVNGILYRTLASRLNGARMVPGRHRTITGIEQLDKVVHVDQSMFTPL